MLLDQLDDPVWRIAGREAGRIVMTATAECRCEVPRTNERQEYEVEGQIRDESGNVVARVRAKWLIGPTR